jgi:hypothetical protein
VFATHKQDAKRRFGPHDLAPIRPSRVQPNRHRAANKGSEFSGTAARGHIAPLTHSLLEVPQNKIASLAHALRRCHINEEAVYSNSYQAVRTRTVHSFAATPDKQSFHDGKRSHNSTVQKEGKTEGRLIGVALKILWGLGDEAHYARGEKAGCAESAQLAGYSKALQDTAQYSVVRHF